MRGITPSVLACLTVFLAASSVRAEDSDRARYYLTLRMGDRVPGLTDTTDVAAVALGVNWGRRLSFELALDSFEVRPEQVSEMGVLGLTPQVRLRWPLLSDRLSPYLLAGFGVAVSQPNDARVAVQWSGGKTQADPVGTLGGGIDCFIADNIAFVIDGKYFMSGDRSYTTSRGEDSLSLTNGLFSAGVRVFYPELHPERGARAPQAARVRFYVKPRIGAALLMHGTPFTGVKASPEQPIFSSNLGMLFGVAAGAELNRFTGVGLSLDSYELKLALPNIGTIGDYALFPMTVNSWFRYPVLEGALEPYALCGVGAEMAQINDKGPVGREIATSGKDLTVIGQFGAGAEYRLMSNVTIGIDVRYVISRGHHLTVNDEESRGNLDALLVSFAVNVVFFSL